MSNQFLVVYTTTSPECAPITRNGIFKDMFDVSDMIKSKARGGEKVCLMSVCTITEEDAFWLEKAWKDAARKLHEFEDKHTEL